MPSLLQIKKAPFLFFIIGNLILITFLILTILLPFGHYRTPGAAREVTIAGNYAYVTEYDGGLRIIDIHNPTLPWEVGYCDTPEHGLGVAVAGNYAYIANDAYGLRVINITNPSYPSEIGYCDSPGHAHRVVVAENLAYLADDEGGLRIINITDPSSPSEIGFCSIPKAKGIAIAGTYAYVATSGENLRIVNISDPLNPSEVGYYPTSGWDYGVAVTGDYACVADNYYLRILNISDPTNPIKIGDYLAYYDPAWGPYDIKIVGTYVFVTYGAYGLRIIDISNPIQPSEVGIYDINMFGGPTAYGIAVAGEYVYIACDEHGLLTRGINWCIQGYSVFWIFFGVIIFGMNIFVLIWLWFSRNGTPDFTNEKDVKSIGKQRAPSHIIDGTLSLLCMMGIYGGITFIILRIELILSVFIYYVLLIIEMLYPLIYLILGVGVGIILFSIVLTGLKRVIRKTMTRKILIYLPLIFLGINIFIFLINLISIWFQSTVSLLYYVTPFTTFLYWNELVMDPILLIWHLFGTIIALGSIISVGILFLTLSKRRDSTNLKGLTIYYLFQIELYFLFLIFI
ncbi:MAG: hypothetical protein HWN65_04120 [Candidatus Helarchaeota archaeon]|nr:hypothetical protein [Candidatus Helarchaeota archaeon]